ncbi:MAG: hypothetical protein K0R73_1087 [Candidatus Midichloriaceae bacterium]|jgi:hypothetical protein|nr:hypothetical protein [Candidatus Midichloriaceae bacterium]
MSIGIFLGKMVDVAVGLGILTMMIGIPSLVVIFFVIKPAFIIRKEMKRGKTFRQAYREAFKENGKYHHLSSTRPSFTSSTQYTGTSIID